MRQRSWKWTVTGVAILAASVATAAAVLPRSAPANPLLSAALDPARRYSFTGTVEEALTAGPYTYLRVSTPDGDRWVVTLGAAGRGPVEVSVFGTATGFMSRRLGRTFPELQFARVTPPSPAKEKNP